jgi:CubicO group peptidase (beta-lactamase class C family)
LTSPFDPERFEQAAEHAQTHVESGRLPSALVAVANREATIAVRAFNEKAEVDPSLHDRIFALASITKAIVGVGIARLVDRGRLDYSDPVAKHVPDLATPDWRTSITIGDIFTHSTGLRSSALTDFAEASETGRELDVLFEEAPHYQPGTRMLYNTLTYQLLNEIVLRLLGRSMSGFLAEYVFEPCGMVDTAFAPTDRERAMPALDHPMDTPEKLAKYCRLEVSGGGLWATAGDLIRLAQALLQPGKLLSPDTFRLHTEAQPRLPCLSETGRSRRTLGWNKEPQALFPLQPDAGFYHGGATGTLLWIDPERELIFVFLTNRWINSNDEAFVTLGHLYG